MAVDGSVYKLFFFLDLWGIVLHGHVYLGPYPSQKLLTRIIDVSAP